MIPKVLLVIPITTEKPVIFKKLFEDSCALLKFDVLLSISCYNKYLNEYKLILQKHSKQIQLFTYLSKNKSVLFKNSIHMLHATEWRKYDCVMSLKEFNYQCICTFYQYKSIINNYDLKLFYPKKNKKSFTKTGVFIVEKNFLKTLHLNPHNKLLTLFKIFIKTSLKGKIYSDLKCYKLSYLLSILKKKIL